MAELVDALHSGCSNQTVVQVRSLFRVLCLLDLFGKSFAVKIEVMNSSNQVKSKGKPSIIEDLCKKKNNKQRNLSY